jgi:hypothetical protein
VVYRLINFVFGSGTSTKRRWSDLINKKRAGQPITKKERPAAGNVVDLGRAAPERRRRRAREAVETLEEAVQGGERNSDVDRGQEACKGSGCEEDGPEAAAQVGLATPQDPGPTFFQTPRRDDVTATLTLVPLPLS